MKRQLRDYQKDCVLAIINEWNHGNYLSVPYASVMTGLGKSLIMADITSKALSKGKRVLQLVPRLELVEQNYKETIEYLDAEHKAKLGIVCGQLNSKEYKSQAVIAMYTSFYKRRASSGHFDVVLIDECDNVGNNKDSQYRKIITSLQRINPKLLVAGVTASPYRLGQGMLHESCLKGERLFTTLAYDTSQLIPSLIARGDLANVDVVNSDISLDLSGVRMSGYDYNVSDMGVKFDAICEQLTNDLQEGLAKNNIKTCIIFVSTVNNANNMLSHWRQKSEVKIVHGGMGRIPRQEAIHWFKDGRGNRTLINVNILTRGFNFPELESVALCRATTSPGLMLQMIGRLLRPHKGKLGKLFDYGTNIQRLGAIDAINVPKNKKKRGDTPKKLCLLCEEINLLSAKYCKKCGAEFVSENEEGRYSMKSKAQIWKEKHPSTTYTFEGQKQIPYFEKCYSRADSTPMIKILFDGVDHHHYIMLNHKGPRKKDADNFILKLLQRSEDFYDLNYEGLTVDNVLPLLQDTDSYSQFFKKFKSITISPVEGSKFKELSSYELID